MHRIQCNEIWGGIKNVELDLCSEGITTSLYSNACDGGKGGDVYYFSLCSADKISRLALADVVGHGQQVSQMGQWVYGQLENHMNDIDQPEMMQDLNDRVMTKGFQAITTAVILTYYLPNRHVYFSYAGHPPMFSRHGTGKWQTMQLAKTSETKNLPLGVMRGIGYDMGDIPFAKGDKLFLYSDGLLEAPNAGGEFFGMDRLQIALQETDGDADPMLIKAGVLKRLREWTGGLLTHDDVTLIAIQLE